MVPSRLQGQHEISKSNPRLGSKVLGSCQAWCSSFIRVSQPLPPWLYDIECCSMFVSTFLQNKYKRTFFPFGMFVWTGTRYVQRHRMRMLNHILTSMPSMTQGFPCPVHRPSEMRKEFWRSEKTKIKIKIINKNRFKDLQKVERVKEGLSMHCSLQSKSPTDTKSIKKLEAGCMWSLDSSCTVAKKS